jgi:hypothetical protein
MDFSEARDLFVNIFKLGVLTKKLWTVGSFWKTRGASLQNSQNNRFSD